MLRLRVLTVAVLLPAFAAAAWWLPGAAWGLLVFALTLLGAVEWLRLCGCNRAISALFCGVLGLLCFAAYADARVGYAGLAVSVVFWCLGVPWLLWRKPRLGGGALAMIAGCTVLAPLWYALYVLQARPGLMLALLAVIWISDSAAYGAGHACGRHKLAPAISPGKTWEGVGGALVAVAVYATVFHFWWFPSIAPELVLAGFLAMAVLGILGDLYESLLKRQAGVKDSGTLLPGHGGVLDRVDALTAAVPLAALLFGELR